MTSDNRSMNPDDQSIWKIGNDITFNWRVGQNPGDLGGSGRFGSCYHSLWHQRSMTGKKVLSILGLGSVHERASALTFF